MVFNMSMNALAKSDAPYNTERAEALLNRMQIVVTPETQTSRRRRNRFQRQYKLSRSSNPQGATKAKNLLQTMHDLEESGDTNVSPNTIAYSTCILAWRNSQRSDAGKRTDAL